jgi:hypothetical protein
VSHHYVITYEVTASSKWEAQERAIRMLRTDVRLRSLGETTEVAPGFWKVSLHVDEDS